MNKIYLFFIALIAMTYSSVNVLAQEAGSSAAAPVSQEVREKSDEKMEEVNLGLPPSKFELPDFFFQEQVIEPEVLSEEEEDEIPRGYMRNLDGELVVNRSKYFGNGIYFLPSPSYPKVIYHNLPEITRLEGRIDALLYGITTDIEPKYDMFGYEIRRYMAQTVAKESFIDLNVLKTQLDNVHKAKVVLQYWEKTHEEQVKLLEEELKADSFAGTIGTKLDYNKEFIAVFFAEIGDWLNKNEAILIFMEERYADLRRSYPYITFEYPADEEYFIALYSARHEAVAKIRKYLSFRDMVY